MLMHVEGSAMDRLNYNQGKLLKAGALGAAAALLFVFVMINPEWLSHSRKGRWFTSGFGYAFILPLLTASCLFLAYRCFSLAFGNRTAIEFTASHLKLNGYWGLKQVRWADVVSAQIEANMNQPQLRVKTRGGMVGGKSIRLPLGLTEILPSQLGALIAAIEQRSAAPAASPDAYDIVESATSSFDPDEAIARYLARKSQEGAAAPTAGAAVPTSRAPAQPARPSFGRKLG
jgi:hypothetical protein